MNYTSKKSDLFEKFLREHMLESNLSVKLVVELERRARLLTRRYELTGDADASDFKPIVETVRKLEELYAIQDTSG